MTVPEFDGYTKSYERDIDAAIAVFGKGHDFFVKHKSEILLPAFAELGKDASTLKVLDVGCGTGMVHPHIANSVGELHGIDVSGASIDIARRANPSGHYATYDGGKLPYEDGCFDATFAICVLHHVPVERWPAFVDEMRRVVKPGGLVLFVEHNPLNPATQWVVRTCPIDANAVLVKPWTLRRLMSGCGVSEVRTSYVLFTPFAGQQFRRLDGFLSRLPFGAQYIMSGRRAGGDPPSGRSGFTTLTNRPTAGR